MCYWVGHPRVCLSKRKRRITVPVAGAPLAYTRTRHSKCAWHGLDEGFWLLSSNLSCHCDSCDKVSPAKDVMRKRNLLMSCQLRRIYSFSRKPRTNPKDLGRPGARESKAQGQIRVLHYIILSTSISMLSNISLTTFQTLVMLCCSEQMPRSLGCGYRIKKVKWWNNMVHAFYQVNSGEEGSFNTRHSTSFWHLINLVQLLMLEHLWPSLLRYWMTTLSVQSITYLLFLRKQHFSRHIHPHKARLLSSHIIIAHLFGLFDCIHHQKNCATRSILSIFSSDFSKDCWFQYICWSYFWASIWLLIEHFIPSTKVKQQLPVSVKDRLRDLGYSSNLILMIS